MILTHKTKLKLIRIRELNNPPYVLPKLLFFLFNLLVVVVFCISITFLFGFRFSYAWTPPSLKKEFVNKQDLFISLENVFFTLKINEIPVSLYICLPSSTSCILGIQIYLNLPTTYTQIYRN